jgi:hypothetical protein
VNCGAFDALIVDLVEGSLPSAPRAAALQHAEACLACGGRLQAEQSLSEDLLDWAAADVTREASPALEASLRNALRAQARQAAGPVRRVSSWVWPLAAVAAGLAFWSALPRSQAPSTAVPAVQEVAFSSLEYGDGDLEDLDSYQVMRVELSRSALRGLGVAVSDEAGAQAVSADVIVGQDGVARGIRLVR